MLVCHVCDDPTSGLCEKPACSIVHKRLEAWKNSSLQTLSIEEIQVSKSTDQIERVRDTRVEVDIVLGVECEQLGIKAYQCVIDVGKKLVYCERCAGEVNWK